MWPKENSQYLAGETYLLAKIRAYNVDFPQSNRLHVQAMAWTRSTRQATTGTNWPSSLTHIFFSHQASMRWGEMSHKLHEKQHYQQNSTALLFTILLCFTSMIKLMALDWRWHQRRFWRHRMTFFSYCKWTWEHQTIYLEALVYRYSKRCQFAWIQRCAVMEIQLCFGGPGFIWK